MASVDEHLISMGFAWTPSHAIVTVCSPEGRRYRVAIPVSQVQNDHAKELAKVGCPLPAAVGGHQTAVGFFKALKRAVRRVSRGVRKLVPKAIRRAARKVYRRAARAVTRLRRTVRSVIRSPALKGALLAASWIPGAAAVTMPTLAAMQTADAIDRKIALGEAAAKQMMGGVRNAAVIRARQQGLDAIHQVKRAQRAARNPANRASLDLLSALRQKFA